MAEVSPLPPNTSRRKSGKSDEGEIWWTNGIFFVLIHIYAVIGVCYLSPITSLDWRTAIVCLVSWQLASFGITIGYHRLWSHRAFTATTPLRIILACMGSMGFQGSIQWWVLRHRLHHRFTDSDAHDPYSASKGLWFSHCGWIFRKRNYSRMSLIERSDLLEDPVVQFQHKNFVPMAFFLGWVVPTMIAGFGWNDWIGGLVWGGTIARLLIWHTTFCINSLAHWTGLQPYTEEVTARGNYILALLTSGEGNHNFHHAFPKDFRNGPHAADWDPTKWIIWMLHKYTSLVPSIAQTPDSAIRKARARVYMAQATRITDALPPHEVVKPKEELPVWSRAEVRKRHGEYVKEDHIIRRRVLVLLEGCVVDVGGYLEDHPGGQDLLLSHCVLPLSRETDDTVSPQDIDSGYASSELSSPQSKSSANLPDIHITPLAEEDDTIMLKDATRAFFGGMNNHSIAAKEWMRCLRVARLEK
ncbi:uncharacterized protein I303_107589 [Kwoniella dejecticola CBS 10117]|uniref:Acyl-CoA desaturase n=1 Tax=Kwoniella dejecticola CBS 10117 TaxID=1296121 RepID=A0A1A5ZV58_9TREE|nr:uncharacterized protein I303_07599 [Kwoniella dejecticola CBS 10117]OBR81689.1 hypothetical protein I303_07599 [Kwoniella dejecticola CBS 10117]